MFDHNYNYDFFKIKFLFVYNHLFAHSYKV